MATPLGQQPFQPYRTLGKGDEKIHLEYREMRRENGVKMYAAWKSLTGRWTEENVAERVAKVQAAVPLICKEEEFPIVALCPPRIPHRDTRLHITFSHEALLLHLRTHVDLDSTKWIQQSVQRHLPEFRYAAHNQAVNNFQAAMVFMNEGALHASHMALRHNALNIFATAYTDNDERWRPGGPLAGVQPQKAPCGCIWVNYQGNVYEHAAFSGVVLN